MPRTRQEFKNESSRAYVLSMPSGHPLSRTRSQSSQSLNATTPWLGIGFDGGSARGLGREDEVLAHEELLTSEERESCSELGGDAQLQQLQAELERVRHLEALLEIEKEISRAHGSLLELTGPKGCVDKLRVRILAKVSPFHQETRTIEKLRKRLEQRIDLFA